MPYGRKQTSRKHFTVTSTGSAAVSTSAAAPSTFPVLELKDGSAQFSIDQSANAIRNNGLDVGELVGTLSMQPTAGAGNPRTMYLWAEMSMDGVTWTPVDRSLRKIDVRSGLSSFVTINSRGDSFPAGAWVRWQMYADDTVTIDTPADVPVGASVATGYSVLWELAEVI